MFDDKWEKFNFSGLSPIFGPASNADRLTSTQHLSFPFNSGIVAQLQLLINYSQVEAKSISHKIGHACKTNLLCFQVLAQFEKMKLILKLIQLCWKVSSHINSLQ